MFLTSNSSGLVGSGECCYDREADFVNSVGKIVDLIGEEVIGDYRKCTGGDTERGVHEGLGNTG